MQVTYKLKLQASVELVNNAWYAVRNEPDHDLTFRVTESERGGATPLDGRFCHHRLEELLAFLTPSRNKYFASIDGLDTLRFAIARQDIRKPTKGGCFSCQLEYMKVLRDSAKDRAIA